MTDPLKREHPNDVVFDIESLQAVVSYRDACWAYNPETKHFDLHAWFIERGKEWSVIVVTNLFQEEPVFRLKSYPNREVRGGRVHMETGTGWYEVLR